MPKSLQTMHLIVFSTILTPRIKYIFSFIFKDILKAEVEFTGNKNYFLENENFKISYGEEPLANELFFKQTHLLFSNKLDEFKIKTISFGEYQAPFPVKNSALPFDVFAASFFILSRYEEYWFQNTSTEDFKASKSHQHKWKILDKPIIDEWALIIKNMIKKNEPNFKFQEKKFTQQPTLNLNFTPIAPKGFVKKTKYIFSSVFSKNNGFINAQYDKITGVGINNERVLAEVQINMSKHNLNPIYFLGFPNSSIDYIINDVISNLLANNSVGLLRPCAQEKQKVSDIKTDLSKLKKILPDQINLSSQQLEILKFPICYLNLLSAGITSDYSMGYADTPSFRAGTCTPFNWYDLQLEKVTPLNVKSYCITDSVLQYMNFDDAKQTILFCSDAVNVVNGSFYSSWTLRSLSDNLKYKKLKTLFSLIFNQN
ncbi:DUF7033 domain-containing protein [Pedobacter mucosus]|uniref:DUF7033 domain-containing protein n=1 Tax=Pedobacter mucosus TaxID=2895286 RepID=UPI001EE4AAF7|nr:hypothetical protein [Pedobacter mucosus]UKT63307.1 hypothetical protein LOK61_16240 [Pedobacter mucosus]